MPQTDHNSPGQLVDRIVSDFDITPDHVRKITNNFVCQMRDGIRNERAWQLPSYVTRIPNGTEKGNFLSVDLGGTNCRICLVELHGDSTFSVAQTKYVVPSEVMVNSSYKPLFSFISKKIGEFLAQHPEAKAKGSGNGENRLRLGFTFSFTCDQTSLERGTLIHWDKGWDIPVALGKDPCAMLQDAIDKDELPVLVSALANDSVGTLLTRSYTTRVNGSTLAGVIMGTGTNAAYVEKLSNVERVEAAKTAGSQEVMVINTEWGCFDDAMQVLPRTQFDDQLDAVSTDPGSQMLEKRVGGMYLGELFRLVLLHLHEAAALDMVLHEDSPVFQRERIDSSFLSYLAKEGLAFEEAKVQIMKVLSTDDVSRENFQTLQRLAAAIGRRAGRLSGAALAAILVQSGRLSAAHLARKIEASATVKTVKEYPQQKQSRSCLSPLSWLLRKLFSHAESKPAADSTSTLEAPAEQPASPSPEADIIDIGVDGSVIEFYPTFEADMREAMRQVPEVGEQGEGRVRIGLTKGGSAVGAALMAQAAMAQALGS